MYYYKVFDPAKIYTHPLPFGLLCQKLEIDYPLLLIRNIVSFLANPSPLHFEKIPSFINFAP